MGAELQKFGELPANVHAVDIFGMLEGIVDADTARKCIDGVKRLEDMLKAADEYGEYASKFCVLEAQMYIKISDTVGAEKGVPPHKRALIEWLRSKTEDERDALLETCMQGTRISRIKANETRAANRGSEIAEYERISTAIQREISKTGRTTLTTSRFYDEWNHSYKPKASTIKAYVEKTRDDIRKDGGIGLGDSSGTYVMIESGSRDEIAQAVSTRLKSIVGDLTNIKQICDDTHFKVPRQGIRVIRELLDGLEAGS